MQLPSLAGHQPGEPRTGHIEVAVYREKCDSLTARTNAVRRPTPVVGALTKKLLANRSPFAVAVTFPEYSGNRYICPRSSVTLRSKIVGREAGPTAGGTGVPAPVLGLSARFLCTITRTIANKKMRRSKAQPAPQPLGSTGLHFSLSRHIAASRASIRISCWFPSGTLQPAHRPATSGRYPSCDRSGTRVR